jgi:outer membrane protein assembly factor BamB
VPSLPDRLPDVARPLWRVPLPGGGLGGVAATEKYVIVSGRDLKDTHDLWRCLDAATGKTVWSLRYPAPGNLDFGSSPRATPLIHGGMAYLAGAFGHLHAVDLATGKVRWKYDTAAEFNAPSDLTWGLCGSPVIAGGKLIHFVGGPKLGIAAFDPVSGAILWKTPGGKPGYGSLLAGTFGGVEQVVGYDETTLGGWEVATGRRLWSLTPDRPKDFNVPTPIAWRGRIIVATENNATRVYGFDDAGRIVPRPEAVYAELRPDTHTPVRVGDRLFGVHNGLHRLDLSDRLKADWVWEDDALSHYTAAVASDSRLLLMTMLGEAILVDITAKEFRLLDRKVIAEEESGLYSHPAFAGGNMYLRTADGVICLPLGG